MHVLTISISFVICDNNNNIYYYYNIYDVDTIWQNSTLYLVRYVVHEQVNIMIYIICKITARTISTYSNYTYVRYL